MQKRIENRIEHCRGSLAEKQIDTFMVLNGENRRYLSNFTSEDGQCNESAGALFISEKDLILATDSRYELQASQEAGYYNVFCYKKGLVKALPDIFKTLDTHRLGFEKARLSYKQYQEIDEILKSQNSAVELVATENIVEDLRVMKDEQEIDATRKALAIAEKSFLNTLQLIQPGMTEKETAWILEKEMREAGADALSFPTIVASGPNSAIPHAIPGDRRIEKGEPILFDWGARLNGYCSDTSRTIVLSQADDRFRRVFQTVIDAQKKSIAAIKGGVSSKAIDRIARDYIAEMGYKDSFGHGLGHGTGLAVHEAPHLSPLKDSILNPGMLVTVEPGIYLPGWGGIRIENQVVVREDGAEVLNNLDLEFMVFPD